MAKVAATASINMPCTANLLARRLNNSAASCIEIGRYGRAVSSLKRALVLCKQCVASVDGYLFCDCPRCTLDGCISASSRIANPIVTVPSVPPSPPLSSTSLSVEDTNNAGKNKRKARHNTDRADTSQRNKARKKNSYREPSSSSDDERNSNDDDDSGGGYVHRNPIRVAGDDECHCIRSKTLSVIIAFNIALALHLTIVSYRGEEESPLRHHRETAIEKTMALYEQLLLWDERKKSGRDTNARVVTTCYRCPLFAMIVHNNLSQVYRASKRHQQQQQQKDGSGNNNRYMDRYLANLLSAVMVVVEETTRTAASQSISQAQGNVGNEAYSHSVDNIMQNVAPLLLRDKCAESA